MTVGTVIGEKVFRPLITRIALDETVAVPVGVDDYVDEVGIVKTRGARRKRLDGPLPRRRPGAPQQCADVAPNPRRKGASTSAFRAAKRGATSSNARTS
jgi:hypothetical protein